MTVLIVLKQDQRTISSPKGLSRPADQFYHPHGIKVRLTDGQVGRVKEIVQPS
ncbi:MAG: DUF2196 domain-containing protein [Anaerolineales bacterium]|nr:DUF2196 domain-containing protein [Anaerolineales bacterium]